MKKRGFSKRVLTALFALLISSGMILSSCGKSDDASETSKGKKSKKTETVEVIVDETESASELSSDTTEPTTTETTEPTETSDPGRLQLAGTYEGYAKQTKAEFYPEKGTVNDYPILQNDGSFRLVLNADGTGSWEDAQTGSYDIVEWTADGETVSVTLPDRTISGTVRNGLVCMNDTDMFWFYAEDGADPSLFGAITPDEATVVTGIDYYFGIGPEGYDVDKAVSCFQSAAAAGVPDAYYWLGRYYRNSTLCIDHYTTAMEYFEKAIELGSAYGLIGKGTMYVAGQTVNKDTAAAYELYKQAADAGCLMGFAYMGDTIRTGEAPGQSGPEGSRTIELCEKALSSKHWIDRAYATFEIGRVYEYGAGDISKDATNAIEWYKKASEMGYGAAAENIARMYDEGRGVSVDHGTANYWYEIAVAQGNISAAVGLGYNYYHGIGTSLNYEEAFRLYLFAAENGSKVGAYDVGISYYNGNGTPQNYAEAFRWFEAAARDEYALAYTFLGDMYKDGLGVTKNEAMALDRYIEGALHGSAWSASRAGDSYLYGECTSVDYYKALDFYALGMKNADLDDENGKKAYDYCQARIAEMVNKGYIRQDQANAAVS
ncbi:MAG: sel1 repeat family protein [Clostridiales bacterium]|nr:sel1 repeat family protein [Clostridiales bacterium]